MTEKDGPKLIKPATTPINTGSVTKKGATSGATLEDIVVVGANRSLAITIIFKILITMTI